MLDIKPAMAQTCTHRTLTAGCQDLVMEREQCTSADAWTVCPHLLHNRQLALHNFAAHGIAFSLSVMFSWVNFTSHCARCVMEDQVANAMSLLMLYLICVIVLYPYNSVQMAVPVQGLA